MMENNAFGYMTDLDYIKKLYSKENEELDDSPSLRITMNRKSTFH
jgi:hypothetical protein